MKIGLLLGTFDPIHRAHTTIAQWALDTGAVDEVWFMPSPQNPLKNTTASPFENRVAMIELAIGGMQHVCVSRIEETLSPPYYTINSVELLKKEYPANDFCVLCGTDVVRQTQHWHRICELRKLVNFVEYPRCENCEGLEFLDVSSSEIRQGEKWEFLDHNVRQYIEQHNLYNFALERGRQLYAQGDFSGAINAWQHCKGTAQEAQAATLSKLAADILAYRYTEIYNP